MTYEKDYKLADKMQKQFRGRGSAVSGMQASSTSDLMRRAEMGKDPRVNCAEQAFRENYRSRQAQTQRDSRMYNGVQRNGYSSGNPYSHTTSNRAQTQNANRNNTRSGQSYRASYGSASGTGKRVRTENARDDIAREDFAREDVSESAEIKIKHKSFPPMFLAFLLIGTLMVMFLVLSISEVYQSTSEITKLENQLEQLQSEAEELELRLDEKNDVRKIEEIATKELGMVKEDSLQRRYVSLSDGEYIELIADENEADESTGGVMLSSIFSSLDKFFERFK